MGHEEEALEREGSRGTTQQPLEAERVEKKSSSAPTRTCHSGHDSRLQPAEV